MKVVWNHITIDLKMVVEARDMILVVLISRVKLSLVVFIAWCIHHMCWCIHKPEDCLLGRERQGSQED